MYSLYNRGSEWRKWDLHIHTPETKKEDRFTGANPAEKWNNFIDTINSSTEDISVVGITDYFSIENYFKFKDHMTSGRITKKFDAIFPNIELRITPVTSSATPINIHCIFNPSIDSQIEARFLAKLRFDYSGSNYAATKQELIRLGRALPSSLSLTDEAAYKAGINQYVVSHSELKSLFDKDPELKENTVIVVSNKSNDGATGIVKHEDFFTSTGVSQLDATRWAIYQFSDALFSSNPGDILYFIAKGPDDRETVLKKCKSLMPCFHGCDAHSNDKVFKPFNNRFCWIKADPTFEGLRQTLYEPEDRVKIQALKPDVKNDRYVISALQFKDSSNAFGKQTISLNENLNAIIGGKSSGKSLLLYVTARSIDPSHVDAAAKRLGFEGYTFEPSFDFEVVWKNGDIDSWGDNNLVNKSHKIIYIPQLYINYLVEKNKKEDLNTLIKSILLQDSSFKVYYDETMSKIADLNGKIEDSLKSYLQLRLKLLENQSQRKDNGKSASIIKGIEVVEKQISQGQLSSSLSEEEFNRYQELLLSKSNKESEKKVFEDKESILNKIVKEVELSKSRLLGDVDPNFDFVVKGEVDRILDELSEIPLDLSAIRLKIETDFTQLLENLRSEISSLKIESKKSALDLELQQINFSMAPYVQKLAGQDDLKKLTLQLETEKKKLTTANVLEKQYETYLIDYSNIRKQIAIFVSQRISKYNELIAEINRSKSEIGSGITLHATVLYKSQNFALLTQANKAAIPANHYFNDLFSGDLVKYEKIPDLLNEFLRVSDDKLFINDITQIPLRQRITLEDILRGLTFDHLEIDYNVTYKGDELLKMSPGKKGTVLLILFLQISSSEYPILIDQPEDNLDNRTIYDLLCQMIKEKKKERQIIIVSHNANLVVATDTENIIVANQEGQGYALPSGITRFEYVNGSIEHSFQNIGAPTFLQKQGIKEHVCDILEGGNEAFKQRELKYSLK